MTETGEMRRVAPPPLAAAKRSDRDLLRAVQAGSEAAAEALAARHWDRAPRIAFGILGDAHFAEDVTQEAMVSVLANIGRFDVRRPFEPSAQTAKKHPGDAFLRSRRIRGLRFAAAALAICLALTSFALFTEPGHAVTSWVGERLGFGQPGEPPSLRQLRAGWTKGTAAEGQPAHVLAVGPVPGGGRYEFITYWPEQPEGVGRPGAWDLDGPCFELDLTQMRSSYGEGCGVLPEGPHLAALGLGGGGMPGEELHHFAGRTSMAVEEVEAQLGGRRLEAELVPIPAEFVERFRLERRFKFFVGFLAGRVRGGTLTITARDGSGEVLARKRFELVDRLAFPR